MLSKRANVLFIERARVVQKDGRVLYLARRDANRPPSGGAAGAGHAGAAEELTSTEHYFNIPHQNTMLLLLGQGTSITDSAARMLAEANVVVGFVGSGGAPFHAATEPMFLMPQSEYRPTEYMQAWMRMWLDDAKRLQLAKMFLLERMRWTEDAWAADPAMGKLGIVIPTQNLDTFERAIKRSGTTEELLGAEGDWAKGLYGVLARGHGIEFSREDRVRVDASRSTGDLVNGFLSHGNYLAYGFSAVALYALGISFALPLLHGKTRRGALVFDVADLFKDALVMPLAFSCASEGGDDSQFRTRLIDQVLEANVLDRVIQVIQKAAST